LARANSKRSRSSAKSRAKRRVSPRNTRTPVRKSSAKLKGAKEGSKSLLTATGKPGRKSQLPPWDVGMRAYDLKMIFETNRQRIDWDKFVSATSEEDLHNAMKNADSRARELLLQHPNLLLATLLDKQFPKQSRKAREQFIADSLAAEGRVSIRRSRDVAQSKRSAIHKQGKIIRREFYIECSCGYEGPAFHDACPHCRAPVSYLDFRLA